MEVVFDVCLWGAAAAAVEVSWTPQKYSLLGEMLNSLLLKSPSTFEM